LYGDVVSKAFNGRYDGPFTMEKLLRRNISHQAIFYHRAVFGKVGKFDLRYRAHADWDLNIRCFGDPEIKTSYLDLVIAEFGVGGVSGAHDIVFLREVLVPERLKLLNRVGGRWLRGIRVYDEWWRIMRNAGLRSERDLDTAARGEKVPAPIRGMVSWQRRFPPAVLRKGIVSKTLMFVHYFKNRLTGSI
jgi:hypothetical protein